MSTQQNVPPERDSTGPGPNEQGPNEQGPEQGAREQQARGPLPVPGPEVDGRLFFQYPLAVAAIDKPPHGNQISPLGSTPRKPGLKSITRKGFRVSFQGLRALSFSFRWTTERYFLLL